MENKVDNTAVKEFTEERFEFALYINDFVICKRNFRINAFIEGSMQTLDFKYLVDDIVNIINNDLKSKSRVYTWYYYDENYTDDEFSEELPKEWENTFKFVISDNGVPVIEKIWDGYGYPKSIMEKIDLTNKFVRVTTKDGRTYTYDKESFFEQNKDKLPQDLYVVKAMISDKQDLLRIITRKICEYCSPREDLFMRLSDYTTAVDYDNCDSDGKASKGKTYQLQQSLINMKVTNKWSNACQNKTKKYLKNLF